MYSNPLPGSPASSDPVHLSQCSREEHELNSSNEAALSLASISLSDTTRLSASGSAAALYPPSKTHPVKRCANSVANTSSRSSPRDIGGERPTTTRGGGGGRDRSDISPLTHCLGPTAFACALL